jgi:hypothetical protein
VQVLSGKWWLVAPSYVASLFSVAIGFAVFAFTLHDKEFPIYRAVHGVTGSMILVVTALVTAHIHTTPSLLTRDGCRRISGTLSCYVFTCTTRSRSTRRKWRIAAIHF